MIGYKAFDKNLQCRGFQYEVGKTYELDGEMVIYRRGFHFCSSIADVYGFYPKDENTRVCKIEALGDIIEDEFEGVKYCTNKIRIVEEITEEQIRRGNLSPTSTGYCNVGVFNSGNYNVGGWNTGDHNVGNSNAGDLNVGECNIGRYNVGDRNIGDQNVGDQNVGDWNTGRYNVGDWNTGDYNLGRFNTGNNNTGKHNTGDWNTGDWNTGCFNTDTPKIRLFNRESNWTQKDWLTSRAKKVLDALSEFRVSWVRKEDMTESEKRRNEGYDVVEGFIRVADSHFAVQWWWDKLPDEDKQCVKDIPNFDPEIFESCTGIRV